MEGSAAKLLSEAGRTRCMIGLHSAAHLHLHCWTVAFPLLLDVNDQIWKPDQQLKPALGVLWELQPSPINEKDSVQARRECESSFEESSSARVRETSLPMPTLINRGTCFLISYFSFQAFAWIYFNRSIAILSQLYLWERRLYSSDYFLLLHLSSPC